jgi:PfaB family protein
MDKIAIIGMAGLFPGAHNLDEFWHNLITETDSRTELDASHAGLDPAPYFHPDKAQPDRLYSLRGGFIDDFVFSADDLTLPADKLTGLDRLYHWSLHVGREALRDGGYLHHQRLQQTGVILGNLSFPTRLSHQLVADVYLDVVEQGLRDLLDKPDITLPRVTHTNSEVSALNTHISGLPAAIVAQGLGLGGAHFALDAACASSLYAIKLACDYLQTGRADMMLAGAVSASDPLNISMGFSIFQALPQAHEDSRPLNQGSKGLVAAEGAGMLLLKRYDDAVRDSDHIYATILGTGLSNDGSGKHVLTPKSERQVLAFSRAYDEANLPPSAIDYIECHATGTPLGDMTEMNSIDTYFGEAGAQPKLGSVKSNLGHLLTTAGMASVMKIILAMQHGEFPATLNITEPLVSEEGNVSGAQIVQQRQQWTTREKIAAVNAFGFGGTNAHLVLASPDVSHEPTPPTPRPTPMAIIGMDALFGSRDGLNAFEKTIFAGEQHFTASPDTRWSALDHHPKHLQKWGLDAAPWGAYIEQFEMDYLAYKIPPAEDNSPIPQQMLVLKVADRAIRDAALNAGSNTAVIVAMESETELHQFRTRVDLDWQIRKALAAFGVELNEDELAELAELAKDSVQAFPGVNQYASYIGNIMASRVASLWDFSGPAFTVSADENGVTRALEIASIMLDRGEVEAVVVGGVHLAGSPEHILLHHENTALYDGDYWPIGEGAGAVVLMRADEAPHAYATIDAVTLNATPQAAINDALQIAELSHDAIDYQEVNGSLNALLDNASVIGSVKANLGHAFSAGGIAGLIKVALCLHNRYLPATPGEEPLQSGFEVPSLSRPWFSGTDHTRHAALSTQSIDELTGYVLLSEPPITQRRPESPFAKQLLYWLPILGDDEHTLLQAVAQLREQVTDSKDLGGMMNRALEAYTAGHHHQYCAVVIGTSNETLLKELDRAATGIPKAFQTGKPWQTLSGSTFSPNPQPGKVAFVYPGAFNAYPGLGRDLMHSFPDLHDALAARIENPAYYFDVFPGGRPTDDELRHYEVGLADDTVRLMQAGIGFAAMATMLMRETFHVEPDAVCGYSMGESTMYYATGVIQENEAFSRRFDDSPMFSERLLGNNLAAAEFTGHPPGEDFWLTVYLFAPREAVEAAIAREEHVYITQINTPDSVVVSGLKDGVERVLQALPKAHTIFPAQHTALHSPAIAGEYDALIALHEQPTQPVTDMAFYSTTAYDRVDLTREHVPELQARMITQQVDFPRLIQKMHADGHHVFIELGPRNTCTRWVESSLKGQPHVATAIAANRNNETKSLLKMLATLASNRVPLHVEALRKSETPQPKRQFIKQVQLGGRDMYQTLITARDRFTELREALKEATLTVSTPATSPTHSPTDDKGIAQHIAFLRKHYATIVGKDTQPESAASHKSIPPGTPAPRPEQAYLASGNSEGRDDVIWDEAALLEFAQGKIANVFGEAYAQIDQYDRRVRLPLPPYLLVSRITHIDGNIGEYKPCSIVTEYDIPANAWYSVDGQAPWAVSVESGQCDLMLISYLGIDFENKGVLVYRLLDCTLTFLDDLPKEGDTLRYDIHINSYARSGDNLLFFFSYDCYIDDRKVLIMRDGCAGFFSDDDLADGRGVIDSKSDIAARAEAVPQTFDAPLLTDKRSLSRDDMLALVHGDVAAVFGVDYDSAGYNPSLRLPPESLLMIDRIPFIDPNGGAWGLGLVEGEKDLHPDHWYFPCHFMDDQVMAGSLMAEGCGQLLQAYMLLLGLQTHTTDARFQPIFDLPQVVRCRGQVTPQHGTLIYRMEVREICMEPTPAVRVDVDIILDERIVVRFVDLGLQLIEKDPTTPPRQLQQPVMFDEHAIATMAKGTAADVLGPEFEFYDRMPLSRIPNGELTMISRIIGIEGERFQYKTASIHAEYDVPADAWYYQHDEMPYAILMEIGLQPCGFLSAYLGTTIASPQVDYRFRNLDGSGHLLRDVELRGKTITNHATLLNTSRVDGMIIQNFSYELSVDGEPFYVGDASFGHFVPKALEAQVGLDRGQRVPYWFNTNPDAPLATTTPDTYRYGDNPNYSLRNGHFRLLDEVKIGQHYVFGQKAVDPTAWFFDCHFFNDPVMPGSLGVEAMFEAMQSYALYHGLGSEFRAPKFEHVSDHKTVWKYRGQILRKDPTMALEVHITDLSRAADGSLHITGNASLWNGDLRIYEISNLALRIAEGDC